VEVGRICIQPKPAASTSASEDRPAGGRSRETPARLQPQRACLNLPKRRLAPCAPRSPRSAPSRPRPRMCSASPASLSPTHSLAPALPSPTLRAPSASLWYFRSPSPPLASPPCRRSKLLSSASPLLIRTEHVSPSLRSVKRPWSSQCSATSGVTPKAARYGARATCSINCLFIFLVQRCGDRVPFTFSFSRPLQED
jgi:hypothetical protein